jgi:D-alanyl-D-alanine carboxypeptidase
LDGADGVKTGFTKAAGRILVSSCTRQGRRLIAVTINDRNDWNDHRDLLERGFANYTVRQIVAEGDCLGTIPVISGERGAVELLAAADFSYSLAADEICQIVLSKPDFVYAPIVQAQHAGYAYVCIGDNPVGKVPIVFGQTIEMESVKKPSLWERLFTRR